MYDWNSEDSKMSLAGIATDGVSIYSYSYDNTYNKVKFHDNGNYESAELGYYDGMYYRRYAYLDNGETKYWWKACASQQVEINIGVEGDGASWHRYASLRGAAIPCWCRVNCQPVPPILLSYTISKKVKTEVGGVIVVQ